MSKGKPKPIVREPGECVHRWRIDPPNGAESGGTCSKCGALKMFRNSEGGFSTWAEMKSVAFDN